MTPVVTGPAWLSDDMLRVEDLLASTAGASAHPLVSEPASHLLRAGGKRLRPALVLISARAGEPSASTDLAAAALELVHLATLYHDDVIDQTQTRRGVPTAHSKWGTEIAVLAGDYLFACGCGLGAAAGGEVPTILARAIAEVCEGQIVETGSLGDPHRAIGDYLETIKLKTAALFRTACELGAATGGVDGGVRASLASFGENVGLAFQIVDDLIDLLGDPDVTGKKIGTDLKEGVFTAPVLIACKREPDIARMLADGARDVEVVVPMLLASGAIEEAAGMAAGLGRAARAALDDLPASEWRDALDSVVTGVLAQL